MRDNLITTSLSLLKTQLRNVIQNWNPLTPQKLDKETQNYDDF